MVCPNLHQLTTYYSTVLYKSQVCMYPYTFCLFHRESPNPLHMFPQYYGTDGPMVGFQSFLFFQLLVELIMMAAPASHTSYDSPAESYEGVSDVMYITDGYRVSLKTHQYPCILSDVKMEPAECWEPVKGEGYHWGRKKTTILCFMFLFRS